MATIKFSTGQTVNFNGNPTPQDVDEVAKQLGISPGSSGASSDPKSLGVAGVKQDGVFSDGSSFQKEVSSGVSSDWKSAIPNLIAAAQSSQDPNPITRGGEDVLASIASGLSSVLAPITEGIKAGQDAFSNTKTAQNIAQNPTVGKVLDFFQGLGKDWNNVAKQSPQAAKDVENALTVLTASLAEDPATSVASSVTSQASDAAGAIASKASDVAESVAGAPARAARSLVPLGSDVKGIITNPEDAKAMSSFVKELQSQAKTLQGNPRALSPKQSVANQLFGDSEGSIAKTLQNETEAAGKKMGAALANPAVGGAKMDISSIYDNVQTAMKKGVTGLTGSQRNDLNQFAGELQNLKSLQNSGKLTISEVDSFLRDWQPLASKYKDTGLAKVINENVGELNKLALDTADKAETDAGLEGHPYRESNTEYKKFITYLNKIRDARGEKDPESGHYVNAHQMLNDIMNPDSKMKTTFDSIEKLVGQQTKSGGMTMTEQSGLASFIQDLYTGKDPKTMLANLPSFGFGVNSAVYRIFRSIAVKATTNPDTVVNKILDVIDKGQK